MCIESTKMHHFQEGPGKSQLIKGQIEEISL